MNDHLTRLKSRHTSRAISERQSDVDEALVDEARALEGGDERVGELRGDVAPGGERGVALVES